MLTENNFCSDYFWTHSAGSLTTSVDCHPLIERETSFLPIRSVVHVLIVFIYFIGVLYLIMLRIFQCTELPWTLELNSHTLYTVYFNLYLFFSEQSPSVSSRVLFNFPVFFHFPFNYFLPCILPCTDLVSVLLEGFFFLFSGLLFGH